MFIPGNANQYFKTTSSDPTLPELDLRPENTGMATRTDAETKLDWEHLSINYTHENRFFKGFFFALPVSILMWVAIIWGIKALIF